MGRYCYIMDVVRVMAPRDLGAAVRSRRQVLGWSQTELAARAGVSRRWVGRLETGANPGAELQRVQSVLAALGAGLAVMDVMGLPGDLAALEQAWEARWPSSS